MGLDFPAELVALWEAAADSVDTSRIRHAKLRIGVVLGKAWRASRHGTGFSPSSRVPFRFGVGAVIGTGRQLLPWVHIEDMIGILLRAIDRREMRGRYNAVSPGIVTHREFVEAFARCLGRPVLWSVPEGLVRFVVGEERSSILLRGQFVRPKRTLSPATCSAFRGSSRRCRTWFTPYPQTAETIAMLRKDIRKAAPTGTADPAEVARFDALAEEWWKPDGAFKTVHAFNRVRVEHISARLPVLFQRDARAARPLAGLRIIDVGCGAGLVAEPLSLLGADVLGIDAAERNVRVAERHAGASGAPVRYRHALPEDLAGEAGAFDVVLSLEVVEHVADLPAFLQALARLVAPGGVLIIGTLNRTLRAYVKAIIGAEYVLGWLPRGTHDWRKFVTPVELDVRLRPHGLRVVETIGCRAQPADAAVGPEPRCQHQLPAGSSPGRVTCRYA